MTKTDQAHASTTIRALSWLRRRAGRMACVAMLATLPVAGIAAQQGDDQDLKVKITPELGSVTVDHFGTPVRIQRIQDTSNKLVDDFAKTSRPCPPFCIHPMHAVEGVQTVGEVELLHFLQNEVKQGKGLLVDARMPEWYEAETIPGAINIPFVIFTTPSEKRDRILQLLGGVYDDKAKKWDFSKAPKLLLFCNGPWCDQSPRAIRALVSLGYPKDKLLYYRGGMTMWKLFGLTTVLPHPNIVGEKQKK